MGNFDWQHIQFENGSNPYICNTEKEFKRMQKKYNLVCIIDNFWKAMPTIEEFMKSLTFEEIDLGNKISNLCESGELENEMMFDLISYNIRVQNEIYKQIKKDVYKYKDDIISETEYLFENKLIKSKYDYSSGLYNMDKLYVDAIREVFDLGHCCYCDW